MGDQSDKTRIAIQGLEAGVLFHIESHEWLKAVVHSLAN